MHRVIGWNGQGSRFAQEWSAFTLQQLSFMFLKSSRPEHKQAASSANRSKKGHKQASSQPSRGRRQVDCSKGKEVGFYNPGIECQFHAAIANNPVPAYCLLISHQAAKPAHLARSPQSASQIARKVTFGFQTSDLFSKLPLDNGMSPDTPASVFERRCTKHFE
jgi:hypothetical protein